MSESAGKVFGENWCEEYYGGLTIRWRSRPSDELQFLFSRCSVNSIFIIPSIEMET
jgi:hypothetical protein